MSRQQAKPPAARSSFRRRVDTEADRDFKGWGGKTIVKLMNGQISRHREYYDEYHYAYMPKALLIPAGRLHDES
jgi:hypothetical protein